MEPLEVAQRLRHHIGVVSVLFLAGLLVPVLLHMGHEKSYVGTARLLIGGADTNSAEESSVSADLALGIITSAGHVEAALRQADVERDPRDVAQHQVEIQTVGASGVLELSVSDRDRAAAASIANALADGLVALRSKVVTGDTERLLDDVTLQIDAVSQQIEAVTRQVSDAEILGVPVGALRLRHDEALRQRNALEEQRQRLIESLAETPKPTVLDRAKPPAGPEPSGLIARLAVGGLLGLALGLAVAGVLETLRPTIMSPDALARVLGASLLGRLPRAPQHDTVLRDLWLPECLSLAANEAGVRKVRLVPVGPPVDLNRLAGWLRDEVDPALEVEVVEPRGAGMPLTDWVRSLSDPFPEVGVAAQEAQEKQSEVIGTRRSPRRGKTGVVVVAPNVLRRNDLDVLEHRLAVTGWPLLGIVAYQRRWFRPAAKPTTDSTSLQIAEPARARSAVPVR